MSAEKIPKKYRQLKLYPFVDVSDDMKLSNATRDFRNDYAELTEPALDLAKDKQLLNELPTNIPDDEINYAEELYAWLKHRDIHENGIGGAFKKCQKTYPRDICIKAREHIIKIDDDSYKELKEEMQSQDQVLEEIINDRISNSADDVFVDKNEDDLDDAIARAEDMVAGSSRRMVDILEELVDDKCYESYDIEKSDGTPPRMLNLPCYLNVRERLEYFINTVTPYEDNNLRVNVIKDMYHGKFLSSIEELKQFSPDMIGKITRAYDIFLDYAPQYDNIKYSVEHFCKSLMYKRKCEKILNHLGDKEFRHSQLDISEDIISDLIYNGWTINSLLNRIRNNKILVVDDAENSEILEAEKDKIREVCEKSDNPEICDYIEHYLSQEEYIKPKKTCYDLPQCNIYKYEKCYPLIETPELIEDGVEVCAEVYVTRAEKRADTKILFRNKKGISSTVGCVHIAVGEYDDVEQCNTDEKLLEHAMSSELKPIEFDKLRPIERFYALNATLGEWLDIGLENMFTMGYEGGHPEDLPFGFNSMMHQQMMTSIAEVSPRTAEKFLKKILTNYAETEPEWLKSHMDAVLDRYHLRYEGLGKLMEKDIKFESKIKDFAKPPSPPRPATFDMD